MARTRPPRQPEAGEGQPEGSPPDLSGRHRGTLDAIYAEPTRANVAWNDVEALFRALGAEVTEGRGSRVRVALNGERAVFHRPHPEKELSKSAVRSVREFLGNAGVGPGS